jgi:TetR/AcrR family transcriptional repressor of nem operon
MKVSRATAARHREALRAAASRLLREKGFDKFGIAEVAAAAGLTHGAFYTHFASKEALCAEAVEAMTRASIAGAPAAANLDAYVAAYLSPLHVAVRGEGCPFAALAGEVTREGEPIRAAFARGVEGIIDAFAAGLRPEARGRAAARARAIGIVATLVGGLLLARGAGSPALRDEILAATAAQLRARGRRRSSRRTGAG